MDATTPLPLIHLSSDFIRAKEYLETIVTSSPDAICTTDLSGRLVYFSPGAETMMGYTVDEVIGHHAYDLYSSGKKEAQAIMGLLKNHGQIKNYEIVLKKRNGQILNASLAASLLKDRREQMIGTLGIFKDITERVKLERRLNELCRTDNLTGLSNRRHFTETIKQELLRSRRQNYPLSLVLMDLDGFKLVNDSLGHKAGDRLLKSFSAILRSSLRQGVDLTFRYGGDEFIALLPGLTADRAQNVIERILLILRNRPEKRRIRFSYGISSSPPLISATRLIQLADQKMYAMKKSRPK